MKRFFLSLIIPAISMIVVVAFVINGYHQNRCLFRAIDTDNILMAQDAIDHGAFINLPQHIIAIPSITPINRTPLIAACKKGNGFIVALLLDNGANINQVDNCSGETPLLAALAGTKPNRFSLALSLIERGADVHCVQDGAESPFQRALFITASDSEETIASSIDLLSLLIENNVDQHIYVSSDIPITYAARFGNNAAILYLIENKHSDIDSRNMQGRTALMTAVINNHPETVELLLQLGANIHLVDDDGKSVLDYAPESLVDIIENYR